MSGHSAGTGAAVRAKLDHPVIDADGHIVECGFLVDEYVRQIGGPAVFERWQKRTPRYAETKMMWWGLPSGEHTADRAMSMLPRYFAARMDECGIDFAHMISTAGIAGLYTVDDELRGVLCRALNTMYRDLFRDVADRVRPVALIPTYTPEEAIRELEYAVNELGHKAIMIGTEVRRPVPEGGERWQSIAIDPPHDYDPFWQRCVDLRVAPICHTSLIGAQNRRSPSNYVFNHLGMFAGGSEHFARGLFFGGVLQRFPTLTVGLMEGGVAWAVTLLNDIIEHFEKRNAEALLENLNPADLDVELLARLFEQYGDERLSAAAIRKTPNGLGNVLDRPAVFDEFAASGMRSVRDLRRLFCERLYFGCEADDRMLSVAFNPKLNPVGVNLNATFGSDIGHWDVLDATGVLGDAWNLVEQGLITQDDFRAFTYTNPAALHTKMNPDYFKGTVIE